MYKTTNIYPKVEEILSPELLTYLKDFISTTCDIEGLFKIILKRSRLSNREVQDIILEDSLYNEIKHIRVFGCKPIDYNLNIVITTSQITITPLISSNKLPELNHIHPY